MCGYCDTTDYSGEPIPLIILIDGKGQYFEVDIFYDLDRDETTLRIDGTHTDVRININFCPMCGKEII